MRRSFADSLIVNLGSVAGALIGLVLTAAVLRQVDGALVDSDQIFTWMPWVITVGAAVGILAALSLFRRADPMRVAATYVAVGTVAWVVTYPLPSLGVLILLAPTMALLLVRYVRDVSWERSERSAATTPD